ncbi:MAG: hypothetical protein PHR66_08795 [Desulfuromonadaceae bacterium]|nr:hypothetical protein [Desulfuromonadaceae bacterium]
MKKIRYGLIVMWLLLFSAVYAEAGISIGIGLPNLSIGINLPLFPELVPVPGYPVYYAPQVDANYFFYDGMYWVYQDDNWYASSWYNGPWSFVEPEAVPLFILRIPVRYYTRPPAYFRGWHSNAPPRWGQHWGRGWEQRRGGWDRWDRGAAPRRAPLPVYQRQYSRDRYPGVEQQHSLRSQQYRYQPRDRAVRQHFQQQPVDQRMAPPAQRGRQNMQDMRNQWQQPAPPRQQAMPPRQGGSPDPRLQQQRQPYTQRGPAPQQQRPLQQATPAPREQQPQRVYDQGQKQQERGGQDFGKGRSQGQDDDRGRGRDRNN